MRLLVVVLLALTDFSSQGATYQWVKQLGGSGQDMAVGTAIDSAGNVWVVGNTFAQDFPTAKAVQPRQGGAPLYLVRGTAPAIKLYGTGSPSIFAAAFSPCDGRTLFALSNESLYRSQDLGITWKALALPNGAAGMNLSVGCDQAPNPTVYAGTQAGVFRSRDFANWELVLASNRKLFKVSVDPNVQTTIYANSEAGFARSLDSGRNWQFPGVQARDLSFARNKSGTIYAPISDARGFAVPSKSTDFGATWKSLSPLPGRDNYPQIVFPDPLRSDVLYALGFVSRDDGATWEPAHFSFSSAIASDDKTIYTVSNSKLIATEDGFTTTKDLSPAFTPYITSISASNGMAIVSASATRDIFIAKLDAYGEILFSTYFGGSGEEFPTSIAVDSRGALYITGNVTSTDFPTTAGAFRKDAEYQSSTFLLKMNPDGSIAYSTYFSAFQSAASTVLVDDIGSAYVAGTAFYGGVPTTPDSFQPEFRGVPINKFFTPSNAFVAKFRPNGSSLVYATYLGEQTDSGSALAVASDGSAFVGGSTHLFHLSPDGRSLVGSLTLGERQIGEYVTSLAVGPQDTLYAVLNGSVLEKLTSGLEVMERQVIAGASSAKLSINASGDVLLSGGASPSFTTVAPFQGAFSPSSGFVSLLASDSLRPKFSTFVGDRRLFAAQDAALAPGGSIVFVGSTLSAFTDLSNYYPFAPMASPKGESNVFVAKLSADVPSFRLDSIVNAASLIANPLAPNEAVIARGQGFPAGAQLLLNGDPVAAISQNGNSIVAVVPAGFTLTGAVTVQVLADTERSNTVLMLDAPGSPGIFYIANADGTRNELSNPAAEGEEITILVSGGTPGLPVTALVLNIAANVISTVLTGIEGLPGPVFQIRINIPQPNIPGFKLPPVSPLQVVVGGVKSQRDVNIFLK